MGWVVQVFDFVVWRRCDCLLCALLLSGGFGLCFCFCFSLFNEACNTWVVTHARTSACTQAQRIEDEKPDNHRNIRRHSKHTSTDWTVNNRVLARNSPAVSTEVTFALANESMQSPANTRLCSRTSLQCVVCLCCVVCACVRARIRARACVCE